MHRQHFFRRGFLAILFVLLAFASGCGTVGSENQITQMNQAFLPDGAEASPAGEVTSKASGSPIAPEENQPEESGVFVSDNGKSDNGAASDGGGKKDGNTKAVGSGNSKGENNSAAANNNKNSGINSSKNRTASNGSGKNNDTSSNSKKNHSSKADKSTAEPTPTEKPQPTPVAEQKVCTISIDCRTILGNMDKLNSAKKPFVPENGVILPEISVKLQQGDTVFDILSRVCKERGIHMESSYTPLYGTYYVEGIHQLYEFDCGKDMSGWMYFVNGVSVNYSCSKYVVKAGDAICWSYTCDGGKDLP